MRVKLGRTLSSTNPARHHVPSHGVRGRGGASEISQLFLKAFIVYLAFDRTPLHVPLVRTAATIFLSPCRGP
jgi:hypothetical protein